MDIVAEPGIAIVQIDTYRCLDVRAELQRYLDSGCRSVVMDFADIECIFGTDVSAFVRLYVQLTKLDGTLVVCNVSDRVSEVFGMYNIQKRFEMKYNREAALESLKNSSVWKPPGGSV
jgi:anti-anti-sigma factor